MPKAPMGGQEYVGTRAPQNNHHRLIYRCEWSGQGHMARVSKPWHLAESWRLYRSGQNKAWCILSELEEAEFSLTAER